MVWGVSAATNWQLGEFIGNVGGGGGGDVTPPSFISAPVASNITYLSLRANFTVNESSTVYGIVVLAGSQVPTPAEILAGVDYGGVIVQEATSVAAVANVANFLTFSNLVNLAEQDVVVYLVARDSAGNLQTQISVRSIPVTLGAVPVTGGGGSGSGEPTTLLGTDLIYEIT